MGSTLKGILSASLLCTLAMLLVLETPVRAADGTALWTNVFNGPADNSDNAVALAVDGNGNVFVTGYSYNSSGNADYATIKYSNTGVPLWTNIFNGAGNSTDNAQALALDNGGNAYVTGYSIGSGGNADYATIKYSSAGVPLWTNFFNGAGNTNDYAAALVVDGVGNVVVTGYSIGSSGHYDYATIKYSSSGAPLWTNVFKRAASSDDSATAMTIDASGNVFVTGYSAGSGGNTDFATIKYSGAGVALWTNMFNGAGDFLDSASAVALDSGGNVYVTGNSGGSYYGSGHYSDYATIKYSNAGTPLWTNLFNGMGNAQDQPHALVVDGSGNVFVSGDSTGSGGYTVYATIKYSSSGLALWTNIFSGLGNTYDSATAIAVDGSGNVYVTGYAYYGGGSSYNYATIKYSGAGVPLWTNLFNGAGNRNDFGQALVVDGGGNVYVTGASSGIGGSSDFATIKYSGPPVVPLLFTAQTYATNRQFRFTFSGPTGSNAVISASTNLQSWTPLFTNPLVNGTLQYTDTLATNFLRRFYRAQLQ